MNPANGKVLHKRRGMLGILTLIAIALSWAGNALASQNAQSHETGTNLVVQDIKLIGVSSRLSFLGRGFAEIIQLALLRHPNVNTISRTALWQTLRNINIPAEERTTQRIFSNDVLEQPNIQADYILNGKIIGLGDSFQLSPKLITRKTGDSLSLGPYIFTEAEIISTIEFLAQDISVAMQSDLVSTSHQEIAVYICTEDSSNKSNTGYAASDLTSFLSARLQEETGIYPRTEHAFDKDCVTRIKNSDEWNNQHTTIMVYYKVGIRSEEALEKIVVSPILLTNKADLQVSMVELVEPMENYRALRDNFLTLSLIYVKKAIEDGGLDALTYLAQMDASSIKDPSVKADIIQGKNLFKAGEVVFALPFFQRAIRKDRTNQEANYYIGRILAMNKKYSESIDFYQSAINGTEPYTEAYVALGDTYFSSGEYIEAKNQYQAALNIDNSNIKAKRGLAYIYLFTESLDKASQHFEEIVQVNQNDIDSLNALGSIAIKKRKYDEALLWFEKSLVVEPSNERAKSSLSVVYDRLSEQAMNSGDIDKAIQYITNKIALKKSRETYGMADDIFTRSQLELKKAVHDKSAASDAISDLVYLKEMLGNDNDQKFVFADTDLAIAYFMAGDYEKSKNLIVNSLYTYQDNPEIPVFNRAMHIASTLLLNEDYKFQLHLLTEQIEYLKKPRNIGKDLNQRYELLRQYLSYNENIKMKKKEKLVNVTELAWGMKDAATD